MALKDLTPPTPTLSDAERIRQTERLVARTFATSVSDLGTVEMRDGQPALVFDHEGELHTLTWRRDMNGVIHWTLDGRRDLILSTPERAIRTLMEALQ